MLRFDARTDHLVDEPAAVEYLAPFEFAHRVGQLAGRAAERRGGQRHAVARAGDRGQLGQVARRAPSSAEAALDHRRRYPAAAAARPPTRPERSASLTDSSTNAGLPPTCRHSRSGQLVGVEPRQSERCRSARRPRPARAARKSMRAQRAAGAERSHRAAPARSAVRSSRRAERNRSGAASSGRRIGEHADTLRRWPRRRTAGRRPRRRRNLVPHSAEQPGDRDAGTGVARARSAAGDRRARRRPSARAAAAARAACRASASSSGGAKRSIAASSSRASEAYGTSASPGRAPPRGARPDAAAANSASSRLLPSPACRDPDQVAGRCAGALQGVHRRAARYQPRRAQHGDRNRVAAGAGGAGAPSAAARRMVSPSWRVAARRRHAVELAQHVPAAIPYRDRRGGVATQVAHLHLRAVGLFRFAVEREQPVGRGQRLVEPAAARPSGRPSSNRRRASARAISRRPSSQRRSFAVVVVEAASSTAPSAAAPRREACGASDSTAAGGRQSRRPADRRSFDRLCRRLPRARASATWATAGAASLPRGVGPSSQR